MATTVTLVAILVRPTIQNLQFSPDGQLLLAARSTLCTLVPQTNALSWTPDLGANSGTSSTTETATGDFRT